MRTPKIEKVVLNVGGTEHKLDKGVILLEKISGRKALRIKATKRIPTLGVRPGLEVGTKVTLRGLEAEKVIERILPALNNTLKEKQIRNNTVSFGISEYIEIPSLEYIREVGIMGFEVMIVFSRAGKRVERKKIKKGKNRRHHVSNEEIIKFMEEKFKTNIIRRAKK